MKAYDLEANFVLRAVVHAESEDEARKLAAKLAEKFSDANDCLAGSDYGIAAATEFSCSWQCDELIECDLAYDLAELEAAPPLPDVPADYPVLPLVIGSLTWHEAVATNSLVICGDCDRSWNDSITTSMTPAPSGRCPFEAFHQ